MGTYSDIINNSSTYGDLRTNINNLGSDGNRTIKHVSSLANASTELKYFVDGTKAIDNSTGDIIKYNGSSWEIYKSLFQTGVSVLLGSPEYPINYASDNSTIVQQAIDDVASLGGGVIELPNVLIPIKTIAIKKLVCIRGQGWNSGFISIDNNDTSTGLITLYHYGITSGHDYYADRWQLSNFAIYGNKSNQGVNITDGIYLDAPDGYYGDGSVSDNGNVSESLLSGWHNDNFGVCDSLFISNCSGKGIHIPSSLSGTQYAKSITFKNINLESNNDNGISINSNDNILFNIISGRNGGHGIYLNGENNNLISIKTFLSGATKAGLYLDSNCTGVKILNYESQEEYDNGLILKDCVNANISGLVVENCGTNGSASTNDGVGVILDGCKNCSIKGKINNKTSLIGDIQYGMKWLNSPSSCDVDVQINGVSTASTTRPIPIFTDIRPPITNRLIINNVNWGYPNKINKFSKLISSANGSIADGYTKATPVNTTSVFSIDDEAQKVTISSNTSGGSTAVSVYKLISVSAGQNLRFATLGKTDTTNVTFRVLVSYYDSTYDVNGTGFLSSSTGTSKTDKMYNWATLTSTVPSNATYARVYLQAVSTANGNTGSVWFKELIIEDDAILSQGEADRMQVFTRTASYTLEAGDADTFQKLTHGGTSIVCTVPTNSNVSFPIGTEIIIQQAGAAQVSIAASGGVTIRSIDSALRISAQYAVAVLRKIGTDEWLLIGSITG